MIERALKAALGQRQIRPGHLLLGVLGAQAGTVPGRWRWPVWTRSTWPPGLGRRLSVHRRWRLPAATTEPGQLRRAIALEMSVMENTGVMALGHIAVTGSPARTVARAAWARGARIWVVSS